MAQEVEKTRKRLENVCAAAARVLSQLTAIRLFDCSSWD